MDRCIRKSKREQLLNCSNRILANKSESRLFDPIPGGIVTAKGKKVTNASDAYAKNSNLKSLETGSGKVVAGSDTRRR